MHVLVPLALCASLASALPTFLVHRQLPSLSLFYNASTFSPTGQGITYRSTLNYSCDALSFSYAGSRPPLSLTAHRANDSSLLTVIGSFYATSGNVSWTPTLPEGERYFVRLEDSEGKRSDTISSLVAVPQSEFPGCMCVLSSPLWAGGDRALTWDPLQCLLLRLGQQQQLDERHRRAHHPLRRPRRPSPHRPLLGRRPPLPPHAPVLLPRRPRP